jgi:hypothetical protein
MHDRPNEESASRPAPGTAPGRGGAPSSSSRMLASYLTDLEQLLEERRWDAALREALDLPRIAVALAEPHLRSSPEQVLKWCQEWIRPPGAERDAHGLDHERLYRSACERIAGSAVGPDSVPTRALRRLQLRRHVRAPLRGFVPERRATLPARESEALEICTALLGAARRWYARSACHDPTVQANLARLAVLR